MNSANEKVWFTFNAPLKKLFFNFCHFYFPTFQMTIVKKWNSKFLLKFCYVTNIFDLQIFLVLLKFFEICTGMRFVSLIFSK